MKRVLWRLHQRNHYSCRLNVKAAEERALGTFCVV